MQIKNISAASVAIELEQKPTEFYRHGWQSWSLTTWQGVDQIIPMAMPSNLYSMHLDPVSRRENAPHGSHIGAVKFSNGQVVLLGVLGQATTAGAKVVLRRNAQQYILEGVTYDAGGNPLPARQLQISHQKNTTLNWVLISGSEQEVFAKYAMLLTESLEITEQASSKRIWSSWYSFYDKISASNLIEVLNELTELDPGSPIPFDVFQIDDGWQKGVGDWEANEKFPEGMAPLAEQIRAKGLQPGIWLAPLIATPSSKLFSEHPNWFLTDQSGKLVRAGFNFGEKLLALDVTIPEVADYLEELISKVSGWGFSYLKLDFLYAGALPGKRASDIPREQAYRQVLTRMMNTARRLDSQAYILACGAPIIPSLGACDAIRIGPDVGRFWDHHSFSHYLWHFGAAGTRNAIRTSISRLWLKNIVRCDPDAAYFYSDPTKLTTKQALLQQAMGDIFGFKSTSDLPSRLKPGPLAGLLEWLTTYRQYQQKSLYAFQHDNPTTPLELDYAGAVKLPPLPSSLLARILRPLLSLLIRIEWPMTFKNKVKRWFKSKL
jgi:alpha-galactosidase